MNWYLQVLKKLAVFKGRSRRKEFWMFTLLNYIFFIVAMILGNILGTAIKDVGHGLFYVLYAFVVLTMLAVSVRRLHDVGKSGWMILIALFPIIGWIWLLVLLITDSQPGENQYGSNPKGRPLGDRMSNSNTNIPDPFVYISILYGGVLLSIISFLVSEARPLAFLGISAVFFSFVFYYYIFYQIWKFLIEELNHNSKHRDYSYSSISSPGKVIGYLFIPIYNVYWLFKIYICLSDDLNTLASIMHKEIKMSQGFGFTIAFLTIFSSILILIPNDVSKGLGFVFVIINILIIMPTFIYKAAKLCRLLV